jgi:hypothetical protein
MGLLMNNELKFVVEFGNLAKLEASPQYLPKETEEYRK